MRAPLAFCFCVFCVFCGERLFAQQPDGYVSVGIDGLPNAAGGPVELRARLFADQKFTPFEHLTFRAAASLDVLGFRKFPGDGGRNIEIRSGRISPKLKFVPIELGIW